MPNYTDHTAVLELLSKAQGVEFDNRELVRESHHFVDKEDGQWEPDIISKFVSRPRYTFDRTSPLIDQITGEIDQADFDIRIRPAGGDATKELASLYDGIIRNIESMSNATRIYSQAGREVVVGGLGGWMVKQDWADGDSFDQDLLIVPISNYEDRVYFDPGAELETMRDARYVFVLTGMAQDEYEETWENGSGSSVGQSNTTNVYTFKKEEVVVGQIFYKKLIKKTLVKFSDGSVREETEDLLATVDELKESGTIETDRRVRRVPVVYTRLFDGEDWLNEEQETVFADWLPVVPAFGNFHVREGKVIYRGAVAKMMDPQRVYNYMRSRETEEVALAPRAKYWMTRIQAAGEDDTLRTLNTNADPIQFFNPDPENPGVPQQSGGAAINPGLSQAAQSTAQDLTESGGLFGLNQGRADDGPMSGVAIQSLQNKGDNSTIKYSKSLEVAIMATACILVDAIPRVLDTAQQVRILNEDGSHEMVSVNDRVFDQESSSWKTVNDVSKGKYDVTCDVGPAFKNRQQESVKALTELVTTLPGIGDLTADILLNNLNSPGVDLAAERVRHQMVLSGSIPKTQMTEEEKQEVAAASQQPKEPTPEDKIAEAEISRVQAETADVISKTEDRQNKTQLSVADTTLKAEAQQHKQGMDELTLVLKQQAQNMGEQQALIEANTQGQMAIVDMLNRQAETLKFIREASGVDTIVGPGIIENFKKQSDIVSEAQKDL